MKNFTKSILGVVVSTFLFSGIANADTNNVTSILAQKFPKLKPSVTYVNDAKLYKVNFNGQVAYTNENVDYLLVGGQVLVSDGNMVKNITAIQNINTNKAVVPENKASTQPENGPNANISNSDQYLNSLQNSGNNNERLFYINSQYTDLKSSGIDFPQNTPNFVKNAFPVQDSVKIVYGKGERKIVVLADPDCPYCQQFQKDIDTANPQTLNLTMYVVPYPLSIHPHAKEKVNFLWCQPNKAEAWKSWMDYASLSQDDSENSWSKWLSLSGRVANTSCKESSSDKVIETAKKLGMKDTPTILFSNGSLNSGTITLTDFIAALDYSQKRPDVFVPENLPEEYR